MYAIDWRLAQANRKGLGMIVLTKSIKRLDPARQALLLAESILVQPALCEPVHEGGSMLSTCMDVNNGEAKKETLRMRDNAL